MLRTHVIKFDFEDGKTLDKGKVRRYPFPLLLNQFLILMSSYCSIRDTLDQLVENFIKVPISNYKMYKLIMLFVSLSFEESLVRLRPIFESCCLSLCVNSS